MDKKIDWLRFWIHFLIAGLVGVVVSLSIFGLAFAMGSFAQFSAVITMSLTFAVLGGLYGEVFWERLLRDGFIRFLRWLWVLGGR